jgi:hypothetical protein
MNTFWLKIAGAAIAAVLIFVLVLTFTSGPPEEPVQSDEPAKPGNFAQQVEADREKFSNLPQPVETQDQNQTTVNTPETQTVQPVPEPPNPVEPITLYFKPMSEIDEIEAERLINVAVPGRSIGRLPITRFKLMVDSCRQIIRRWPDSRYAYNAKKLLADMPERYHESYKVTPEEIDISMYSKQREGTKPYTIKESR